MNTIRIHRLLATCVVAMVAIVSASAQSFTVDGLNYSVTSAENKEVQCTGGEVKELITIPEAVTYEDVTYAVVAIGSYAFSYRNDENNYVRKYVIPGSVKTIDAYAFSGNPYLEEVVFNEGLQHIGTNSFSGDISLNSIVIPSTVTNIDWYAFWSDYRPKSIDIVYKATTPPVMESSAVTGFREGTTLFVPSASVDAYRNADGWSGFTDIQGYSVESVVRPQFSLDTENYLLRITSSTEGASIYYTMDGSEPTLLSTKYSSPVVFLKNATVKAIAVREGMADSKINEFTSDLKVVEPTSSINDETLEITFDVSDIKDIEGFPETKIYYIADNYGDWGYETIAQGRTDWVLWDGNPVHLTVPKWYHVYAVREGWKDSDTSYRVNYADNYSTATPWHEWLQERGKLRLYNYDSDATVYYTLDGSDPTKDSNVYNPDDSIAIDHNVTVKWVAMRAKHCNSEIGSLTITDATTKFVMNGISYRRIDNNVKNEVEVTSNVNDSRKYTGHVEIPAEITYAGVKYAVTRIGEGAFYDCDDLTGVTIPTTITSIGRMAFYDCNALATVDIPASVETIEYQSFRYCSSLRSVTLHEGLKTLGDGVFADDGALHQMTLPNSLETIGTDLFVRSALSGTIVIPDALTSIPARTFYECSSLKSVIIGDGVKSIDENAFRSCTSLESVTFGSGINTIAYEAFYGCSSLLSIDLQEGLTSMDTRAFYACSKLTTVSLPTTLTTIGEYAFQSCQSLTTIRLPEGVRSIGRHAFNSTPALKSIYALPATPPAMVSDAHAFQDHLGTATLYVKSSAKDVYESDANWCQFDNIQAFDNIPTTQPAFTFDRNTYLLTITSRDTGASIYYTRDNSEPTTESTRYTEPIALMQNDTVKAIAIAEGMTTSVVSEFMLNNFTTPQPVATMSEDFVVNITCETPAIDGFPETRIYYLINDSYYEVYDGWQLYDGNPIQLTQPKYVHVYAERDGWITPTQTYYDFYNSYYTRYADIGWDSEKQKAYLYNYPEGATVYYTIDGSDPTTESSVYNPTDSIAIARNLIVKALVTLPGRFPSVITSSTITGVNQTFLKDGIYYRLIDNTLANEVETTRGDKNYAGDIVVPEKVTYLGTEYAVTRIGENTFTTGYYNNSQVTSVTLPSSVKSIGQYAFALMNLINEIDIPSSVKTIEYGAFQETNLSKVTFHDGLETIGEHAFYNSNRIQSLTFPSTLKSIGVEAFYNVDGIKSIVFPESVTEIGTSAFWECSSLSSVTLPSGLTKLSDGVFQTTPLQNITIPEGVTSIGYRAFYACASLSSVTIPSSVTAISNEAFYGCTALLSVSIPEGVTTIAERTFQDCTSLTTVSLPSSLTTIATYAFYNCKALPSILLPEQLKSIDTYAFGACEVMTDVYSAALTPPTLSGNANTHAFAGVVTNGTLHTKAEAKELYDNAQNWGSFSKSVGFEQVLAAQPTFVLDNYRLSMATTTAGATIRYTRDGTEPNAESAVYESPLPFMQNDTVRAVAFADGYAQSLVAEFRKADYTVPTPTVTIDDETFVVTLHSAAPDIDGFPETKYYFQINGDYYNYDEYTSNNWHLLEGDTIHLSAPRYIHVFAKRDGWQNSSKVTSNFYSNYYLYSPYIYTDRDKRAVWIKHHDYDNGPSEIYYTLDGSTPSKENGTLYTDTIFIERSLTVKAVTVQDKHFNSDVSSADVSVSTTTFLADGIY
ncbi:MAG: leucine-rich repeat protein, partial [Prevotella sp.]|nr:leucine-rich repeat protein [Prevotella sp.]